MGLQKKSEIFSSFRSICLPIYFIVLKSSMPIFRKSWKVSVLNFDPTPQPDLTLRGLTQLMLLRISLPWLMHLPKYKYVMMNIASAVYNDIWKSNISRTISMNILVTTNCSNFHIFISYIDQGRGNKNIKIYFSVSESVLFIDIDLTL